MIHYPVPTGINKQIRTIRLIGKAIREGSKYLPIRNHAAAIATRAGPKDFLGQVREIYRDFVNRWRYVNDIYGSELLTFSPEAMARLMLALDGVGVGLGRGAGDCDCASATMGAMLRSIGRPILLGTTAPLRSPPGKRFSHVFPVAHIPKVGWITVDPVLFPDRKFGSTAHHSRIALFDLDGKLVAYSGNYLK